MDIIWCTEEIKTACEVALWLMPAICGAGYTWWSHRDLEKYKVRIQALEQKSSLNYQQKIELYKAVSDPISSFVALIDANALTPDHLHDFNFKRLNLTAHLALFASQEVFASFNELLDYMFNSLESESYMFEGFRERALILLSAMRKDIGIYTDVVEYKGTR